MELQLGKLDLNMKAIIEMIYSMAKENLLIIMEMCILETSLKAELKDMEFSLIQKVINMRENGPMIYKMEKERRYLQMDHNLMGYTSMVRKMVKVFIIIMINQYTEVI